MLENLEVVSKSAYVYDFSFESDGINFDGLVKFDSNDERGQTVVEWDDFVPDNWEDVEETLIASCN